MKGTLFAVLLVAAAAASGDRTLGRESAARLFAPIGVVGRVERLEAEGVTRAMLEPSSAEVAGEVTCVTARPFATTVIRASGPRGEDESMTANLVPAATRNYDLFFPDDAVTRTLLPIFLESAVGGSETYLSTNRIETLPAFVHVREPAPGIVVIRAEVVR